MRRNEHMQSDAVQLLEYIFRAGAQVCGAVRIDGNRVKNTRKKRQKQGEKIFFKKSKTKMRFFCGTMLLSRNREAPETRLAILRRRPERGVVFSYGGRT